LPQRRNAYLNHAHTRIGCTPRSSLRALQAQVSTEEHYRPGGSLLLYLDRNEPLSAGTADILVRNERVSAPICTGSVSDLVGLSITTILNNTRLLLAVTAGILARIERVSASSQYRGALATWSAFKALGLSLTEQPQRSGIHHNHELCSLRNAIITKQRRRHVEFHIKTDRRLILIQKASYESKARAFSVGLARTARSPRSRIGR
jgi:hypothetical protein